MTGQRSDSISAMEIIQAFTTFLQVALAWPTIQAWLNKGVTKKNDPYLNYDAEYLLSCYPDEKRVGDALPYVEIVDLLSLSPGNIEVKVVPHKFRLNRGRKDSLWRAVSDAGYESLRKSGRISPDRDDPVVRLNACEAVDQGCHLTLQRASYSQQAKSNLILDYCVAELEHSYRTLRNQLKQQYPTRLPPLSDKRLANTIGIACQLFYREEGRFVPYLVRRLGKVGVMPGGVHCTASGAAEWPSSISQQRAFDEFFTSDMYREIEEEVGLSREDIEDLQPVSICREFLRAGKPQIFYAGVVRLSRAELREKRKKASKVIQATGGWLELERDRFWRSADVVIPPENIESALQNLGITLEGIAALYFGVRYLEKRFGKDLLKNNLMDRASHQLRKN